MIGGASPEARPFWMTHHGPPTLERVTHHGPPTPLWVTHHGPNSFLERVTHHGPPPLGSPSPWCLLQTGTPPPLGSAEGPPPPEKDDSSLDDEWASWRQVLYFDWVVQNINEHLCIMATFFIFRVIGLIILGCWMSVMFCGWEHQCAWWMHIIVILYEIKFFFNI